MEDRHPEPLITLSVSDTNMWGTKNCRSQVILFKHVDLVFKLKIILDAFL